MMHSLPSIAHRYSAWHRRGLILLAACLVLLGTVGAAQAQSGALQSPADFLGYELGSQFTPHHRVMDYVRHVAGQSPNVELQPYGTTYEGRPLLVAFVSSPENLQQLETIRTNNLRRAGQAEGAVEGPVKGIVWLSYNVHGNESVSTEASMQTLYELADPSNARTQPWLDDTVVIIDPCINPDGRERYVQWYNRTVGRVQNPTPEAREHDEPWPGGRTNHYYFDLNRDWAWGVQQETQQRLPLYNRWMPHIHVDFHEQSVDAPYYFAPAAQPYHENITEWQREFQFTIGRNHAAYFDRNNWLYFTREVFDLFYPGYGDTWPIYNGAIGMTYEQGGSGRAGLAIETAEGDTLTLHDRMIHHHTTGLSTVEVAAQNSARMVAEFEQYYATAQNDPPGAYDTYVIKRDGQDDRMAALAAHLDQQGIQYGFADRSREAEGYHYATGSVADAPIAAGDMIVSAYQPKSRLAKVLLEPRPTLVDSLTYDITAWALPYAYGLDAYALPDRLAPDTDTAPSASDADAPDANAEDTPYAYLVEWQSLADVQFLAAILQHDITLRFAEEPFTLDGRAYAAGTLILTRTGNTHLGARFDEIVRTTAQQMNQPLHAVDTGFVEEGSDFGSGNVPFLERPHVAVLSGEPLSSYAVGEVWHFFDQQIQYPATLLNADGFDVGDLEDYHVLVMPSGRYGDVLDDDTLDALRGWIRDGGRLIAVGGGAVSALAGQDGFALQRKEDADADDEAAEDPPAPETFDYSLRQREAAREGTPGSIHRAALDATHPLGFGFGSAYYTLKRSDAAYALLEDDWNVGMLPDGAPVSGFMGHEAQAAIDSTLVAGVQDVGRGAVVYLVDNPLFRGFWQSGKRLFSNAVFLVGQD